MAQIFRPQHLLGLKLGTLAIFALIGFALLMWRAGIAPRNAVGSPVEQPVPFSHKHHVGELGLDCRYCHASVEKAAFAGIPPTYVCMTCHSQLFTNSPILAPVVKSLRTGEPLRWNRVHDLPDFVYFNHGIHVTKGVACATCHGEVERMPLMWRSASLEMQWCLDCHRAPGKYINAATARAAGLTDCSTCHR